MARAMAGVNHRSRAKDSPAAASLHRARGAGICAHRKKDASRGSNALVILASRECRIQIQRSRGSFAGFNFCVAALGHLLGSECSNVLASFSRRSDNLHLLPIVRKFPATIQAGYVGPGQRSGLGAARRASDGHWKTVTGMSATENCVKHSCHHGAPSTARVLPGPP